MRTLLTLTALLLASGARGQTAPLAERIVGNWANADSVVFPVSVHSRHGAEIATEVALYVHLAITDSTITATSVIQEEGTMRGSEGTSWYRIGGGLYSEEGETPVVADVREDSLIFSRRDSLDAPHAEYIYTRTTPLTLPEALLGDWRTEELTDAAGVVFDLPFRFSDDGTFVSGYSEPLAYRVIGPYLLMAETTFVDPASGSHTTIFRVSTLDLRDDRLILYTMGEEPFALYRR